MLHYIIVDDTLCHIQTVTGIDKRQGVLNRSLRDGLQRRECTVFNRHGNLQ